MPWTEKMDDRLRQLRNEGLNSAEVAAEMRMSRSAVQQRARRIGVSFVWAVAPKPKYEGHVAVDERSAEILRANGWRI
jgi:hypothetical protein